MLVPAMLGTVELSSAGELYLRKSGFSRTESEEPGHEMSRRAPHPTED